MFHEEFFELGSFLNDLYDRPDPTTFKVNHAFQVKKELAHLGYCQEFHGESELEKNYKKENSHSNAKMKRGIRNIFKHLN